MWWWWLFVWQPPFGTELQKKGEPYEGILLIESGSIGSGGSGADEPVETGACWGSLGILPAPLSLFANHGVVAYRLPRKAALHAVLAVLYAVAVLATSVDKCVAALSGSGRIDQSNSYNLTLLLCLVGVFAAAFAYAAVRRLQAVRTVVHEGAQMPWMNDGAGTERAAAVMATVHGALEERRGAEGERLYRLRGTHWNEEGNRLAASELAAFLLAPGGMLETTAWRAR